MLFFQKKPKGFVILFASIIAAIIMVISFAMFSVSVKSINLSTTSKEAMNAFNAADSGVSCALALMTTSGIPPVMDCGNFPVNGAPPGSLPFDFRVWYNSQVSMSLIGSLGTWVNTCADVTIDVDTTVSPNITTIYSRGYSQCDGGGNPLYDHPRFLERAVEVQY